MAEDKRHIYQSTTLGLPPLKMVLVHARNDAQNAAMRANEARLHAHAAVPAEQPLDTQAVRKLIEHLESIG